MGRDWRRVATIPRQSFTRQTFFNGAKSLLGIPREYQGRSYEGCVAHVTLVCIRYQWLALEARQVDDPRTIGDLFYAQCQELTDHTLDWWWTQFSPRSPRRSRTT